MPPQANIKVIILLNRTPPLLQEAHTILYEHDLQIFTGSSVADVRAAFEEATEGEELVEGEGTVVDHVFLGAGMDLETRLDIIREVGMLSKGTTVHVKAKGTGTKGYLPFVKAVLSGLREAGF